MSHPEKYEQELKLSSGHLLAHDVCVPLGERIVFFAIATLSGKGVGNRAEVEFNKVNVPVLGRDLSRINVGGSASG
eukprot:1159048-Pelagomonas_calceolata.AAC.9